MVGLTGCVRNVLFCSLDPKVKSFVIQFECLTGE